MNIHHNTLARVLLQILNYRIADHLENMNAISKCQEVSQGASLIEIAGRRELKNKTTFTRRSTIM
jgi:hypothetical protein